MGALVIGLTILDLELARAREGGIAELVADAGFDEDRGRLALGLDAQRLDLVEVGGDDVAMQGEGVALHDGEGDLEAGALGERPNVVLRLILGRGLGAGRPLKGIRLKGTP